MINLLIKNNSIKSTTVITKIYVDPKIPYEINCDEMRVKQVMVNFLSNAFKFTFVGEIKISAEIIFSNQNYDEILVTIDDTGIGIKPEDRDKLFKQFGKLEDKQSINKQGTGLGLSICKKIIRRIGGCIGYEPKTVGSKFYFSFYHVKSDLIVEQIEQNKDLSMKEVIDSLNVCKISEIGLNEQKLNNSGSSTSFKFCRSRSDNIAYIKEQKLDILMRIDLIVNSFDNSCMTNGTVKSNYSQKNPISHLSLKLEHSKLASMVNDSSSKFKQKLPKEFQNFNIDEEKYDDDNEDDNIGEVTVELQHIEKKPSENIDFISKERTVEKKTASLDLPNEVYKYYETLQDDSIFDEEKNSLEEVDVSDNKRINFVNEIHKLSLSMIKQNPTEYEKIYNCFKAYLKFYVKTLQSYSTSLNTSNNNKEQKVNICIVDDNTTILKAAKTIIKRYSEKEKKNIEVIKASDGIEALSLFLIDYCCKKTIKYIITDQNMGFMNGNELIRLINTFDREKSVKLFLCSADNDKEAKELDAKKLNLEFLKKPISLSDIKRILNK